MDDAMAALELALRYSPEPKYPYVYYYMSEAQRRGQRLEQSYYYLKEAAALDTLIYEVYKDLSVAQHVHRQARPLLRSALRSD